MGIPDPYFESVLSCTLDEDTHVSLEQQQTAKDALLLRATSMQRADEDGTGPPAGWRKRLKALRDRLCGGASCFVGALVFIEVLFNESCFGVPVYLYENDF